MPQRCFLNLPNVCQNSVNKHAFVVIDGEKRLRYNTINLLNRISLSVLQIYHWLNRTAMENPDWIKVILIGSSFEKRPLYVVKVDSSNDPLITMT